MEYINSIDGHNLIYVNSDEIKFFTEFLEKKGIAWKEEHKEASVVSLSKSLTGYIKTPRRLITIESKYKEINFEHILRLYNYVYSYNNTQDDELLDINESTQSQHIVRSFLTKLRGNISIGILQDYSKTDKNTKFLKGNVDYVTTFKNSMKLRRNPVRTTVYMLSPDVDINRLIVGALQLISKSGQNTSEAFELLDFFNHVHPITENASNYLGTIDFNSKNIRYKKIASEAAMIIDSLYYDEFGGNVGGESFLVNFDILFEKFIQKILIEVTEERDFSVWKESQIFGVEYFNGAVLNKNEYHPDILYKYTPEDEERDFQPSAKAVIDVKNKANGVFKNSDLYQMLVYNQLLYAKKSILIYPSFFYKPSTVFTIDNNRIPVPEIYSVFIDISSTEAETFKSSILTLIEDVYEILLD
ncbi:McrC family protein [Sutcliffiella deserti]|uniref:McrC family protein n=1 Tax=Sutcliffiella deserti TaxID=2875501 RepID=UPI001CC05CD4|nr:McrC family protein [Sutcliffiella deserti]